MSGLLPLRIPLLTYEQTRLGLARNCICSCNLRQDLRSRLGCSMQLGYRCHRDRGELEYAVAAGRMENRDSKAAVAQRYNFDTGLALATMA